MGKKLIVLFFCCAGLGCGTGCSQFVTATYPGGIEFVGIRAAPHTPANFFSVRVKGPDGNPISADCPLVFHWQNRDFHVSRVTPKSLAEVGVHSKPKDYGQFDQFASVGGADDQNRDYAMEFQFREEQLAQFYARYNMRSVVPCPFSISLPGKERFQFPLSETELKKLLGEPVSVTSHTDSI